MTDKEYAAEMASALLDDELEVNTQGKWQRRRSISYGMLLRKNYRRRVPKPRLTEGCLSMYLEERYRTGFYETSKIYPTVDAIKGWGSGGPAILHIGADNNGVLQIKTKQALVDPKLLRRGHPPLPERIQGYMMVDPLEYRGRKVHQCMSIATASGEAERDYRLMEKGQPATSWRDEVQDWEIVRVDVAVRIQEGRE